MFVSNLEDKVVWRMGVLMRYHMRKKMTWPSPEGPNQLIYIVEEYMFKQVYNDSVKVPCLSWPLVVSYVPKLVRIHT
ncbi:hypothetical protein YC2023_059768 [Brassica napus]